MMKAEVIWDSPDDENRVSVKLEGQLVMSMRPLVSSKQTYIISLVVENFKRPSVYFTTQGKAMKVGEIGREKGCWSRIEISMANDHDKECDSPKYILLFCALFF
jgi:hypothetical protein